MLAFKIIAVWMDGTSLAQIEMGCPYYDKHPDEAVKRYKSVMNSSEYLASIHGRCIKCNVTPFEIMESEGSEYE